MKTTVKRLIVVAILGALGFAAVGLHHLQTTELAHEGLIRFHVVANSDSVEDQAVKLKVRDALLEEVGARLNTCATVAEADRLLESELSTIETIASRVLAEEGYDYEVAAALTEGSFPTKQYGNIVLPAGRYRALKVSLGEAEGKNWWCILFPPLCYVDISDTVAVAEEQHTAIVLQDGQVEDGTDRVKLKLKLLDFLNR